MCMSMYAVIQKVIMNMTMDNFVCMRCAIMCMNKDMGMLMVMAV